MAIIALTVVLAAALIWWAKWHHTPETLTPMRYGEQSSLEHRR